MKFDRVFNSTLSRVLGGTPEPEPASPPRRPAAELRGSGSWAREWPEPADLPPDRRASRDAAPAARPRTPHRSVAEPPASCRLVARPLLDPRLMRLYLWLVDRLEAEMPCCSIHAQVALGGFLSPDLSDADVLDGLRADLVIADLGGAPLVALVRARPDAPDRHVATLAALEAAAVPAIGIADRPSLSQLWEEITGLLARRERAPVAAE